jgi:hypothetical protein
MSKRPRPNVSHEIPLNYTTLESAEAMLAYPGGFAFTAGDFSNLRAIRVSNGKSGHSRKDKSISGIMLEYHDSRLPCILGQWIQEFDSLVLDPNNRLAEVTTWHDGTNHLKFVKFGPIAKILLRTSNGITKEFAKGSFGPNTSDTVRLTYRENPYETLVSFPFAFSCP